MKWKNRGHEFDALYDQIKEKNRFFFFGAGDYGHQAFEIFNEEIEIAGYIDNDLTKVGTRINGLSCISLKNFAPKKNDGIIVTMSQIARIIPMRQLEELGFERGKDFFPIEEFLAVYFVYKKNISYFSSISFLPSTRCNLNCRHCLNFNPFAKSFYERNLDDLKRDVDLFFSCVDRIMLFHISGGEPFLYPYLGDIALYIHENYGKRIDTLRSVTNGSVIPSDNLCEKLSASGIEITVDDYREAVPLCKRNFDSVMEKLEQYDIRHYANLVESWIDLAPEKTDLSILTDEQMIAHRDRCSQSWEELRDGKIFSCNYAAFASVAGIGSNEEDSYDLSKYKGNKKELMEFRLGYSERGYTEFCRKCRGFTPENSESVPVAAQVKHGSICF